MRLLHLKAVGLAVSVSLLSGTLCHAQQLLSPINDSTTARFRYDMEESTIAIIPNGTSFEDIDILERDLLKPMHSKVKICEGVNANYESYFQVQTIETTHLEDWMSTPDVQLITPRGAHGLSATGETVYQFEHKPIELQDLAQIQSEYATNGYKPLMLYFPSIHDPEVEEAQNHGAYINELPNEAFEIIWTDREVKVEPETQTITEKVTSGDEEIVSTTRYALYAPYGYVMTSQQEVRKRIDLPHPVEFVTQRVYSNHVVEDAGGVIPKYTDLAFIEVHPVPVQNEYEVVLRGIPDAIVSQVQIRDYMGNIIQTHVSPDYSNDIITLDASSYPPGVFILIVQTHQGIYTETITKS